ncbi:MAG: fluoride efflux transporter CrcB [Candidatus Hydrogenedentes bacterium]|nr:fluoride efflux transporter CrcB [Candidatus Hydrogenedentota bacterium]
MVNVLLVGAGGFLGSIARYLLGGWVHRVLDNPWLPWGTFAINVLGCLFIGFLAGLAETRQAISPEARLFLMVGILGGFTTFSTFGYETFALLQDGQWAPAIANAIGQVVLGLVAVWMGYSIARWV